MEACPNSSAYQPSSLVTAFHNIPHIDINLNQNVTEFENTIAYYQTIIIWACVPILAAICIFILMSVYFICVCCCCCCQQHDERSKVSKGVCGVLVLLLILLGLGCGGAALWAEFALDGSIRNANNAAMDANTLVQSVQSDADSLDFGMVDQEVMALSQAVMNSDSGLPGYNMSLEAVNMLQGEIPTLQSAFMDIRSNSEISDFSVTLDAIDFVELVRHWTVVAYLIVTILILLLMALSMCLTAMCRSPVCMVIALVFLGLYTFTMWVAVGGNLAYLIVAGDVCDNPDRLIREQFTGGSAGALPPSHLSYYLICDETCYPNPFTEFQMLADQALGNISQQQQSIAVFANDNNLVDVRNALNTFVMSFNTSVDAIDNITMLTNCTGLNGLYLEVVGGDGLCGNGYLYSLVLFAMACGLALTLFLLLGCGSFYAGLFSRGRTFDDETIVYDFPAEDGPTPWQSYGTQQHYHNTEPQYPYNNEAFNMANLQQPAEPPKYTDLQQGSTAGMPASNGIGGPTSYDS